MKVYRKGKESSVILEDIEPFFIDILRQLPADADPGDHPGARARLFSEPMGEADDGDEFVEDWKNFVQLEIRDLFLSAREIVSGDLAALPASGLPPSTGDVDGYGELFNPVAFIPSEYSLTIPAAHMEAWLRVLNQARLVLAARRGFTEKSMNNERPFPPFGKPHERDLFKVNFYDDIQQLLMQEMGYG